MNESFETGYRVFVSYSHEDRELADVVAQILSKKGLVPFYDKLIRPGSAFSDSIKGLISHAHIFMPLLTENSLQRPWVHQEIGFAMALNIPVLPVTTANNPGEMLAAFHAIRVEADDLSNLTIQLKQMNLDQLVRPQPQRLHSMVEVADWPEKRAELLANAARRVIELGSFGRILQWAGLSSFSIPDKDPGDKIWEERDGALPRGDFYHYCLREERRYLEIHAREAGCILLINPSVMTSGKTAPARRVRLTTLLEFLESMPDEKVSIVCTERAREANITIIEDWICSEARSRHTHQGWRQTIFNWHAPTVLVAQKEFKDVFESLQKETEVPLENSRQTAIECVKDVLDNLDH